MDLPSLIVVPPSPMKYGSSPSLSRSSTTTASGYDSSGKDLDQDRTSSETTIFTIYSMYGEEQANQKRWSASASECVDDTVDKDATARSANPRANLALSDNYHTFFNTASELPYYSHSSPKTSPSHMIDLTKATEAASISATINGSNGFARMSSSVSSHDTSASSTRTIGQGDRRTSPIHSTRTVDLTALPVTPIGPRPREPSHSRSSSKRLSSTQSPSLHRKSYSSNRELPPLPPSTGSTPPSSRSPSIRNSNSSNRELPLPHTPSFPSSPPPPSPSPPRGPSPILLSPPQTPLPLKHPAYTSSPSSKTSLVPSEGEDMDAFHVRNTYAQLDMSGVKGDGYEEGVERTRARMSGSRASQLQAENALGDGSEKTGELHPKEIQTIASLDRYGFFTIPSHDRLVLLPSTPLLKRLSRSPAGPSTAPTAATSLDNLPAAPLPIKEASRIAKWARMLQPHIRDQGGNVETWRIKPSKESKLRERTYKGIPDRWRAAVWELMMSRLSKTGRAEMERLGEEYNAAVDQPSSYDIQIDLDVPRTISGHVMFRTRYGAGQRSLFHVLHCFSLRCTDCGYVQGMGPIAATLLCYFEPKRVYASLVRLHDAYSMHRVFSPGFPGLLEAIYVQERITEQMMPDVYAAFRTHMISTTSYATKWYITLFANSVPFQTQLRMWDVFLLEGHDVFVAVAVAIVWVYRDHITSSAANFETVLSLLSSFFVPEDENALLSWIEKTLGNKKLRSNMSRWREEWRGLVASGKDGAALL